jgi:hypothetical protein
VRPPGRKAAVVVVALVLVLVLVLVCARARAEPRVGDPNVLVFGADVSLGAAERTGGSLEPDRGARLDFSVDAFVLRSLSVGADVRFGATKTRDQGSSSELSTWARVGWARALGDWLVFWPRVGPRLGKTTLGPLREDALAVDVFAPIHLVPVRHLALGVGPRASFDLVRRAEGAPAPRAMEIVFATELAGWF